jgi:hypothetical protein
VPRASTFTAAGLSALMPYANTIQGLRAEGVAPSAIWGEIHALEEGGSPLVTGATIFDMNEMVARVGAVNAAEGAFMAADTGQAMDNTMWAWAPWSGQGLDQSPFERYQVRFNVGTTTTEPGTDQWFQTTWDGSLGESTVADMLDYLTEVAQSALDSYEEEQLTGRGLTSGGTVTDIFAVQIMRI